MGFGKIYNTTWFGNPVEYGWGGIYYGLSIYFVLKDDNGFLLQESGDKIIL
jgi:hypothetical protein|tara:strand:- start:451 stop:603 length:153 start_codon:yes stop_codon:yes gene_type:complete